MLRSKKVLLWAGLLMFALAASGCVGSWSQTSWNVPVKLRLLEDVVTVEDLLDSADSGWIIEGDEPLTFVVEDGPFTVDAEVALDLGSLDKSGTIEPTNGDVLPSGFEAASTQVEQRFPLEDLFVDADGADVNSVSLAVHENNRIAINFEPPGTTVVAAWLESDEEEDLWVEAEGFIDLAGVTLTADDVIVFVVEPDDTTQPIGWTVSGSNFALESVVGSFSETVDVDLEPIELGLDFDDNIKELLQGIDSVEELRLVLTITPEDMDVDIAGFDSLEFLFDGVAAEVTVEERTDNQETIVEITGPGLWEALKEFPNSLEIRGELEITADDQELTFEYNDVDQTNVWSSSLAVDAVLTMQTVFEADFDNQERFFLTEAVEVEANPDFVDDTEKLGDLVLFAQVINTLPIGVRVTLELSPDEAFDPGNIDILDVGTIPGDNQSDDLQVFVGDEIENLIQNGGYLRARLELLGSGSMIIRGNDSVHIRAWVEANVNVSFDSED